MVNPYLKKKLMECVENANEEVGNNIMYLYALINQMPEEYHDRGCSYLLAILNGIKEEK